jgi:hypothetical protein
VIRTTGLGVGPVSPGDTDIGTSIRSPDRPSASPGPSGPHDPRDPWLRIDDQGVVRLPLPGQPGHGCTASLRRQPTRIVEGRLEGGYNGAFGLICCECGDHPYLDCAEISPRLQRIRGPYTMRAGLAAYEKHLGLTS